MSDTITPNNSNQDSQTQSNKGTNKLQLAFLGLGLLVVLGLGYGLFKSDGFIYALRSTEVSRGLITFLVAATTVSLAILSALYALSTDRPLDEAKVRFSFTKEILTTLVGILGTVLGFYFGSADKADQQKVSIAEIKFQTGKAITHASGGTEPYRFSIVYQSQKDKINNLSNDGWIMEELKPLPKDKELVSIEITDGRGLKTTKSAYFITEHSTTNNPNEKNK